MGKKAEPLTWRERYVATKIGCLKKSMRKEVNGHMKWVRVDKSPSEVRALLRYREENNPFKYAQLVKLWRRSREGFDTLQKISSFARRVHEEEKFMGYLIRDYVDAQMSIEHLSEEEIARKMVLEAGIDLNEDEDDE